MGKYDIRLKYARSHKSVRDNKIEEKNTVGIIPNQIPKS